RTGKLRGRPSRSLHHTRDRGDGRGLNPPPDERGPAVVEYDDCAATDARRLASRVYLSPLQAPANDAGGDRRRPSSEVAGSVARARRSTRSGGVGGGP